MMEHGMLHRGRDHQRRRCGERGGAENVGRETKGEMCDRVGSGWRHDERISSVGEGNVSGKALVPPLKDIVVDLVLGKCGKRARSNETDCAARHEHMHIRAELDKIAGQICGLVCGDSSADAEHHGFAEERLEGSKQFVGVSQSGRPAYSWGNGYPGAPSKRNTSIRTFYWSAPFGISLGLCRRHADRGWIRAGDSRNCGRSPGADPT